MSKFKNSSGAYLLRSIFWEQVGADKTGVLYTLKDEPHEGFPSLKQLYMSYGDPTEYEFAINTLYGVEHWEALCKCDWFEPYVEQWRKELFLRIQSQALRNIRLEAEKDSQTKLAANKYLLERGWEPKTTPAQKRGRPTKNDIREAANAAIELDTRLKEDFKRLEIN